MQKSLTITILIFACYQHGIASKVTFASRKEIASDTPICGQEHHPCRTIKYALRNQQSDVRLMLDGGPNIDHPFVYEIDETIRVDFNLSIQKSSTAIPAITVCSDHFKHGASIFHIISKRIAFHSVSFSNFPSLFTTAYSNLQITFQNCQFQNFLSLQKWSTVESEISLNISDCHFKNFDRVFFCSRNQTCNVTIQKSDFIGEQDRSKRHLVFSNASTSLQQHVFASPIIVYGPTNDLVMIKKISLVDCKFLHLFKVFYVKVNQIDIFHCTFSSNQVRSVNRLFLSNWIQVEILAHITNSVFTNNTYTTGAVSLTGPGKKQISHSVFENNTAVTGAALTLRGTTNITNCSFIRNKVFSNGGALYFLKSSIISIDKSLFIENRVDHTMRNSKIKWISGGLGGAIMLRNVCFEIQNSVFVNNTAPSFGGTLYYRNEDKSTKRLSKISNCTIYGTKKNTSLMGSLIYFQNALLEINNLTLNIFTKYKFQSAVYLDIDYSSKFKQLRPNCPVNYKIGSEILPIRSLYFFCTSCEKDTYNLEGGFAIINKGKNDSLYQITCHPCPAGGICDQGIIAKDNYWGYNTSRGKVEFTSCPQLYCCSTYGQKCVTYNTCEKNRKGRICGECDDGYSESILSTRCVENKHCGSIFFWIGVFISAFVYTIIILYFGEITRLFKYMFRSVLNQFGQNNASDKSGPEERTSIKENETNVDTKMSSGLLKIFIFFYQIEFLLQVKSSMKKQFKVSSFWTDLVSSIFNFKPSTRESSSLQLCAWKSMNAVEKEVIKVAAIFSVFVLLFLIYVTFNCCRGIIVCMRRLPANEVTDFEREELLIVNIDPASIAVENSMFGLRVKCAFLRLILMTYIPLTSVTLKLINCIQIGDSYKLLFIYGKVECYHNWWQYLAMCILVLWVIPFCLSLYLSTDLLKTSKIKPSQFFYTFAFPPLSFYYYYSTYNHNRPGRTLSSYTNVERLRLLEIFSAPYRPDMSQWIGIVIFRKFILTLVSIFTINPVLRIYLLLLLLVIFLAIHIHVQPYKTDSLNLLESISLLILIVFSAINLYWAHSFVSDINKESLLYGFGEVFLYIELVVLLAPALLLAMLFLTAFGIFTWRSIAKKCAVKSD